MAIYTIVRRVDAYLCSSTEIEADDAHTAARLARRLEDRLAWKNEEMITFDARSFVALDQNENEIDESVSGVI
jgi:hypothetical protein